MKLSKIRRLLLPALWLALLLTGQPAGAAPPSQIDPAAQCAEGVQLFFDGQTGEALPLLEAGFAGRKTATFVHLDDQGICALALGLLRNRTGNRSGALEAYQVALDIFQIAHNRKFEGTTLNNIGLVYHNQGHHEAALEHYQQALAIRHEVGDRAGEGSTLNNIGGVYDKQGRYEAALEHYQQALTIVREVGDRAGEGTTLGNIGAVYDKQGRYEAALEHYQQALAIRREVGDRAGEGVTLNNIGAIYRNQGRYEAALEHYQQALAIAREVGDRAGEGGILDNIGMVYHNQGHHEAALEHYQQALAIRREVGDRVGEGVTLNNIGAIYRNQGRYEAALERYQQALAIAREVSDWAEEGITLSNIGVVYHNQGRYEEALGHYQQALAIRREVGDRAGEGGALSNIGVIYHNQGRYEAALEHYQQALAICREVGDRAGEGIILNNIGVVYTDQGRYEEALRHYQQALAICREVGDRAGEGNTLNNIGLVYANQGRYEAALKHYQQALAIAREVGDQSREGIILNNIGTIYDDQGRYEAALEYYQQALAICREVGDRAGEGNTLNNIGLVYANQGRYEAALEAYQQAMGIFGVLRATAGSEQGRTDFIAQHAGLYDRAVSLFHQQDQNEAAFFTSERGRARALLDSMATGQVQLSDNEAANLLAQEQEAYTQRQAAQDALAKARALNPPNPELVVDLETQLAEAEQTYAEAQAAIEARGDQLADLVSGRGTKNVLGVSEVQALLDEQTTLLSYFVLDDQTLVFLITQDSFEVVELDVSQEELTNQVRRFRKLLTSRATPAARQLAQDEMVSAAQELYQFLIAPVAPALHTSRLAIVPHGPLHYLPFAALQSPDTGEYLLEQYTLTTLPSASVLSFIQENAARQAQAPSTPGLVLGNPTTGDFDDAVASLAAEREELGTLPFAEKEAQTIAALYGVEPLIREDATEGAVWEQVAGAHILHLAAHGHYNPVAPLSSLIALAPDETYDGWLTVGEVYGLNLSQTDLVVLSACQTQLGELSAGDELVGLTRAFVFAGTPTIVASLWNVDDAATALLMERFYTHLREGMGKAAALRQAQLDVIEEYPDPYYWSAFVLSGDGGEASRETSLSAQIEGQRSEEYEPEEQQGSGTAEQSGEKMEQKVSWVWWIAGVGLLVIIGIGGVLWQRRARRR